MRVRAAVLATVLTCGVAIDAAHAQNYPERTIKLVVPFGPGGPTDVAARLVSQVLQNAFGQNVVIENRPGAGGGTGSKSVANAAPDGYTLLIGTSATLGVVPAVMKNAGYDPVTSFVPVARVSDTCNVLVVHPSFPATTLREFAAYGRANPGKLSYASAGQGNQTQLVAEMLKASAGFDAVHVPYKSGSEMMTAVLGQQVDFSFPDISIIIPLVHEGKLRALAVTAPARRAQLAEIPTMVESNLPDVVATFWAGVVAPAGTPPAIVAKLNAAINEGVKSEDTRSSLAKLGVELEPGTPEEFGRFIAAEHAKWTAIARRANISVE